MRLVLKVGGASRGRTNGIPKHIMDQDDPAAIYNWLEGEQGQSQDLIFAQPRLLCYCLH